MSERGESMDDGRLAPVTPLFGDRSSRPAVTAMPVGPVDDEERAPSARHPASAARLRALGRHPDDDRKDADGSTAGAGPVAPRSRVENAGEHLVKRLRTKQLSVREARDVLRDQGARAEEIDEVISSFEERGYLNDQALAEYLVTSGADRKGQGRVAIGRTLQLRGIPRDVAKAALAELEDDDAERALDYARTKAPALSRFDDDTALRRLVGQLARRGYRGSVAMTAARTALREAGGLRSARSGVRFEDSD